MNRRQVLLVAGVVIGAVLVYSPVFGQEDAAKRKSVQKSDGKQLSESAQTSGPAKQEIRVFPLQEIGPGEAIIVLANVLGGSGGVMGSSAGGSIQSAPRVRFSPDPRTRSVIAVGDTEALKQVAALLQILDVPKSPPPNSAMETFPVHNQTVEYAVSALEKLKLPDTTIQPNSLGNIVIVSGPAESRQRAKEFLEVLGAANTPNVQDIRLRVVWLVEKPLANAETAPVPHDLLYRIEILQKKVGIGELRTAAQFIVNVDQTESAEFKSAGTAKLKEDCHLEFSGSVLKPNRRGHRLQMHLSAKAADGKTVLCDLNTIATFPSGENMVILGTMPVRSHASVFVVQTLPDED